MLCFSCRAQSNPFHEWKDEYNQGSAWWTVDYFTKWVEAEPIKDKTADTVANFLYSLICRHGCVDVQINDQGREFVNSVSERLHQLTGVKQRITSAYHPQVCLDYWLVNLKDNLQVLAFQLCSNRVSDGQLLYLALAWTFNVLLQVTTWYISLYNIISHSPCMLWLLTLIHLDWLLLFFSWIFYVH